MDRRETLYAVVCSAALAAGAGALAVEGADCNPTLGVVCTPGITVPPYHDPVPGGPKPGETIPVSPTMPEKGTSTTLGNTTTTGVATTTTSPKSPTTISVGTSTTSTTIPKSTTTTTIPVTETTWTDNPTTTTIVVTVPSQPEVPGLTN